MKLSAQIALIVSALALPLSAYAEEDKNPTPSSNTETTSQNDEVVMLDGIRHYHRHDSGGGSGGGGYWGSIGVGAVSGAGSYIAGKAVTRDEITAKGLAAGTLTGAAIGHVGAPVNTLKKALEITVVNVAANTVVSDTDKRALDKSRDSNKDNDKANNHDKLLNWEREFHRDGR